MRFAMRGKRMCHLSQVCDINSKGDKFNKEQRQPDDGCRVIVTWTSENTGQINPQANF